MNIAIGTTYKTRKGLKTHHLAGLLGFACAVIVAAGIVALDNGGGSVTSPPTSKYGTFTSYAGPQVLYLIVGSAEEAVRYDQDIQEAKSNSIATGEAFWDEYHILVVDTPEAEAELNLMRADLDGLEKDSGIRNARFYDMRVY